MMGTTAKKGIIIINNKRIQGLVGTTEEEEEEGMGTTAVIAPLPAILTMGEGITALAAAMGILATPIPTMEGAAISPAEAVDVEGVAIAPAEAEAVAVVEAPVIDVRSSKLIFFFFGLK